MPLSAKEIAEKKIALRSKTEELMKYAEVILDMRENYNEEEEDLGCWGKRKKIKKIEKETKILKVEYYKLEQELEIYDVENTLKANPVADFFKLILGIFLSFISFLFWLHIILYVLIEKDGKPLTLFMNNFMYFFEYKLARFISTIIFISFGKL